MKAIVVIPTYNEAQNIENLIDRILFQGIRGLDILVVDDNSPDGTAEIVENIARCESNVFLLKRPTKAGLGTAYVAGFKYALEHGYDYIFEMDADFSHDPDEIPNFLEAIKNYDLVIGSRYKTGVNVINWPITRLVLSVGANKYTQWITGLPIKDCTGGYKCFRREVLEAIDLDQIASDGYSFQIEMNFKAWKKGFRITEIPIVFTDREAGSSKMSKKIIREAIWMVWKLKILSLLGKI
ncbi:MAG: polyprenol monophosphomannose synthase [candidate division KSB1 bacterium]|nr:polyprenol monophosphomannose synthase [candidate division KSB1 bacterium]MDZ7335300.1 polyprenol monophosphomannose synthase [candidate division KSB1 bacterium]MDZ7357224.1 polyprenol monophosphomannose synthase [candidate division KSB1 bacterium]MDZ7376963.1 polyprenol monophosphomannose synthase [candidate division KSB1 bacterium]MDZ7399087.1 polyprenol monophosphomannose synthase [candidate division KSB1 bacterium]